MRTDLAAKKEEILKNVTPQRADIEQFVTKQREALVEDTQNVECQRKAFAAHQVRFGDCDNMINYYLGFYGVFANNEAFSANRFYMVADEVSEGAANFLKERTNKDLGDYIEALYGMFTYRK